MTANAPTAAKVIDILVVDDAVVVRRIVSDVLGEDPALRVIATAANGRIALQKLTQVRPDVVTLDFEMPELDGLETLTEIRKTHPKLPVIMFSTLTERGAAETMEALSRGASDYVTKPANVGSVTEAQQRIREQLIPKIKALCGVAARPVRAGVSTAAPQRELPPSAAPSSSAPVEAVVVGVSTGGPNALAAVLPQLPRDLPVPILIVQHMPPMFTRLLAERLNSQSQLKVVEAKGHDRLEPGTVYIAPGDYHMAVQQRGTWFETVLHQDPHENSCRPAVDVLFRSSSAAFGSGLLSVVLTGMGQDGLRGAEEVRRRHGQVIVQDRATSVVWGMPGFVAEAGLADRVVPLNEIAAEIVRRCTAAPSRKETNGYRSH